jgi:ribosomal protein L11 methyltransferase
VSGGAEASGSVPERWFVLTVRSESPYASGVLVDPLLSLGGRAVEERDGQFITHLDAPEQPEEFLLHAAQALGEATGLQDLELSWAWQVHEDWASTWKQGLAPRKLTDRLIISPSWCEKDADEIAGDDSVVIVIDPGMAFGTAEHGTTRGALRLLDRTITPGETLLDAGCGSAILAIAAAKLGATKVLAVDLDPYATEAASDNVAANGVAERVAVETAGVSPEWIATRGPFDGILANIQTEVLVPLLASFTGTLGSGGWLILSGILDEEWSRLAAAAADHGFSLVEQDADGEWRSGCFRTAAG